MEIETFLRYLYNNKTTDLMKLIIIAITIFPSLKSIKYFVATVSSTQELSIVSSPYYS